jgi:RimJ/RimL family protein N-acetyltransferase
MIILKNYAELIPQEHYDLLEIRNLPIIRKVSANAEKIDFTRHLEWVESLKTDLQKNYYAVLKDDTICGGIHLLINDDESPTWGLFFDPKTSPWVISSVTIFFIEWCFHEVGLSVLDSLIRTDNTAAIAFNRQLGFKLFGKTDDFTLLRLDIEGWKTQKEKKILKNILQYATQYPIQMESL